jgi:hypothetical protein
MIRFLSFLFGKPYETCKSCETLKEQLSFEREEKKRLTDTLINILQPKIVEIQPVEINPVAQSSALFSRRRAALEAKDREEAKILAMKQHVAVPDIKLGNAKGTDPTVESLEQELGVEEKTN